MVCDYICSVGGISNISLNKKLMVSAASARQHAYLGEQQEKVSEEARLKRKSTTDVLHS
jgi:hypothetical protein